MDGADAELVKLGVPLGTPRLGSSATACLSGEHSGASESCHVCLGSGLRDSRTSSSRKLAATDVAVTELSREGPGEVPMRSQKGKRQLCDQTVQSGRPQLDVVPAVREALEVGRRTMADLRQRCAQNELGKAKSIAALLLTLGSFIMTPSDESIDQRLYMFVCQSLQELRCLFCSDVACESSDDAFGMIKLGVQGRGCIAVHWHGYFLELPRRSQIDVDGSQPSVVDLTAGDDDDDEDLLKARPSQVVEINSHLREAKLRIIAKGLGGNPDLRPSHVHAYCGHSYSDRCCVEMDKLEQAAGGNLLPRRISMGGDPVAQCRADSLMLMTKARGVRAESLHDGSGRWADSDLPKLHMRES